jgi:hypothetical protein
MQHLEGIFRIYGMGVIHSLFGNLKKDLHLDIRHMKFQTDKLGLILKICLSTEIGTAPCSLAFC